MSGRTIEDFLDNAAGFDSLSDEDKALLASGGMLEGETDAKTVDSVKAEDSGASPGAANVELPTQEPTPAANEPEPVILAKDGQHTIPFSELEAARERTRQLEQELLALKSQPVVPATDANKPTAAENDPPAESNEDKLLRLRREEREAMYNTDTELAEKLGKEADALNRQIAREEMRAEHAAKELQESQENAISEAHRRADALVKQFPILDPQSDKVNQIAIDGVIAERNRLMAQGVSPVDAIQRAVDKVVPMFVQGNQSTQQSGAEAAQKAAEAINKAKQQAPTSLSQVPGSTMAHHDEGEAIRNMSSPSLLTNFMGKSPEQIMELMNKVL